MNVPLQVLLVEDSEDDALLIVRALQRGDYAPQFERVDTARAMSAALERQPWDAIIADYSMPQFSAPAALTLMKERGIDLPFIIVSGSIGEDIAVASMKAGAHDYIMKDNLARLVVAIEREIREAQVRQARRFAEAQTRRQLERLSALRAIDLAISASLDLRVTLDILLAQVTTQLGIDAASVLLLNPHTQTLEGASARGFRSSGAARSAVRVGEGFAGRAVLERRTVAVPNLLPLDTAVTRMWLRDENFVAYYGTPLIAKGVVKGVLEVFHRTALEPDKDWLNFLEMLAGQAAIAIDNATLFESLQRSNAELALAYDTTLEGWSRALDLRDQETEGHTQRVTALTLRLAQIVGIGEPELLHIRRGALLHDIGKMGIPDSVLLKPAQLTPGEWEIMRRHPVYAYELLAPITYLRQAVEIPYNHHEKWDGSGYPRGLKGEQIPLAARIFAVVDVWDALRSDRPYRAAWREEKVREYIRAQAGLHFDPRIVQAFLDLLDQNEGAVIHP